MERSESQRHDRRLALHSGSKAGGRGWWCARCQESGDAADLVALRVVGRRVRDLGPEGRNDLRAWLGSSLPDTEMPAPERRPSAPVVQHDYPPIEDIAALWAGAWDLRGAPQWPHPEGDLLGYLRHRAGAELGDIADTGLCRVLPPRAVARRPHCWRYDDDWRLIFGLWSAKGELRSVLARTHHRATAERMGKERSPAGFRRGGLLLADRLAVDLLRQRGPAPRLVWVVEGPTSALRLACTMRQAGQVDPVIGVFSGAIEALSDIRWPRGATVIIATDDDRQGEVYAGQIRAALPALVPAKRLHWRVLAQLDHEATCA